MADNNSHILFNKSLLLQLRSLGRLGGKAYARNLRARRALTPKPQERVRPATSPAQSTAEAVAVLDSQFPWLLRAEKRRRSPSLTTRTVDVW
jgi:hypothetical protein